MMRNQLGSPGRAGSSRAVQVRNASRQRSPPVAPSVSEANSFENTDADLHSHGSIAARDAAPRFPAIDLDEQTQQQLSLPFEQPKLRVGATDEDTEASCLCGPGSETPMPPPAPNNSFNPVPYLATAASIPILANWYTTNPATHPTETKKDPQTVAVASDAPAETVGVTLTASEGSPLPSSDDSKPVEVTIEVQDTSKQSEDVATVAEGPAAVESQAGAPSVDQGTAAVTVTPTTDDQKSSETIIEEPVVQTSGSIDQSIALEQPDPEPIFAAPEPVVVVREPFMVAPEASVVVPEPFVVAPTPEVSTQLVAYSFAQAPPPSMTFSNALLAKPSQTFFTMQQGVASVMPVSVTQGNEMQGVPSGADGRYPAIKVDASLDAQYIAPPAIPNYIPRPGTQRSANCDATVPGTQLDSSKLPSNTQMNVTSSPGDYSSYYNSQEAQVPQFQSRGQQQMSPYDEQQMSPYGTSQPGAGGRFAQHQPGPAPYDTSQLGPGGLLTQRQPVPDTVSPPANPMPLAPSYGGSGSYGVPGPPSPSEVDPWGLLENQGAYGLSNGLLKIDGGGGGGTYGAFSYGPPTKERYAAPPPNTQEGYRAYGQQPSAQGQQQYYAQPPAQPSQQPQAYSQRGGGQQSYQGAPADGYYYPPAGAAPPRQAPPRRAPEPQFMAPPPPQGNSYSYQASPAGTMQQGPDPYGGQYGGNQPYSGGNQAYSGGNQPYAGGNQPNAGGNQPGNQAYGGNQSYAPAQYGGNQAYSAPPSRAGNYAPPAENTSQGGFPGIELLSPGYAEYEREHKHGSQPQPQQAAPPPDSYYPGIDSTYNAYGMKAPTAPTSNPPPRQPEYYNQQGGQNYNQGGYNQGYSYYTAPSNFQGQAQSGQVGGSSGPASEYILPPRAAPQGSYSQGQYQGYPSQNGGYYRAEGAPLPHAYGQRPTVDSKEAQEVAKLLLPVSNGPDLSLPLTQVSGPVTSGIRSAQSSMKAQLSLDKIHQRHIPIATLPSPTHIEALSGLASLPPPSMDVGLLAAAFCCMLAAKGTGKNAKL